MIRSQQKMKASLSRKREKGENTKSDEFDFLRIHPIYPESASLRIPFQAQLRGGPKRLFF